MFFEKKEDDRKLPDLPAPEFPPRVSGFGGDEDDGGSALPVFPDSPSGNRFAEAAIKDAVGSEKERGIGLPPSEDRGEGKMVEMEEWEPSHLRPKGDEFPVTGGHHEHGEHHGGEHHEHHHKEHERIAPPPERTVREEGKVDSMKDDVFVKIDKFHSARRALGEIKGKLNDIDDLIKKIRETKLREEQELSNWEKDVMHIKARIENVSENIFEKVD